MVAMKKQQHKQHYLPDNGFLALEAAIPADQFIPRLSGYKDIVQLIYKVLFKCLSLLVCKKTNKKMYRVKCLVCLNMCGTLRNQSYLRTAQSYQSGLGRGNFLQYYTYPSYQNPHTSSIA